MPMTTDAGAARKFAFKRLQTPLCILSREYHAHARVGFWVKDDPHNPQALTNPPQTVTKTVTETVELEMDALLSALKQQYASELPVKTNPARTNPGRSRRRRCARSPCACAAGAPAPGMPGACSVAVTNILAAICKGLARL